MNALKAIEAAMDCRTRTNVEAAIRAIRSEIISRFPEGFMVTMAFGKTRTGYLQRMALAGLLNSVDGGLAARLMRSDLMVLDQLAQQIGKVDVTILGSDIDKMDLTTYSRVEFQAYLAHIHLVKRMGMIPNVTYFHAEAWTSRDSSYINAVVEGLSHMVAPEVVEIYEKMELNPRFVGIEALRMQSATDTELRMYQALSEFNESWNPIPNGTPYLIELFPDINFEMYQAMENDNSVKDRYNQIINSAKNPTERYHRLTMLNMDVVTGIQVPMDGAYIGCGMNGHHIRSVLFSQISALKQQKIFHIGMPNLLMSSLVWLQIAKEILYPETIIRTTQATYNGQVEEQKMACMLNHTLDLLRHPQKVIQRT